ncbi:hypothetical protein T459_23833 [Capsicum annuum]|uniref:Uncharacterized protein n=1 Tax=Capsicum annuum TaxID=4072 RepID=A0A2G2YTF4_CAPAN|nr:hypothetical protein T459_23833 [Capsicum annuum]
MHIAIVPTESDGGDRALQISPGVYDERAILGMGLRNAKLCEVTRQQTLVGCWNGGILWVSGQSHDAQLVWMEQRITSHWQDARTILKKPVVLAEFGKSIRGQGSRDTFMSSGYRNIYNLAKQGGTMAGGVVSQLMAHGMENYDDGYCIPSTTNWPFHADTIINL